MNYTSFEEALRGLMQTCGPNDPSDGSTRFRMQLNILQIDGPGTVSVMIQSDGVALGEKMYPFMESQAASDAIFQAMKGEQGT